MLLARGGLTQAFGVSLIILWSVVMNSALDQQDMLLAAWRTNNRVTVFLFEHLPQELWGATAPGARRRTVRMIAGHIHNARCMWIKTLGKEHGIAVPRAVNRYKVEPKELISALDRSSRGIISLLTLGLDCAARSPSPRLTSGVIFPSTSGMS
jgi:uncharacterized damage-inducible protein DinB